MGVEGRRRISSRSGGSTSRLFRISSPPISRCVFLVAIVVVVAAAAGCFCYCCFCCCCCWLYLFPLLVVVIVAVVVVVAIVLLLLAVAVVFLFCCYCRCCCCCCFHRCCNVRGKSPHPVHLQLTKSCVRVGFSYPYLNGINYLHKILSR